MNMSAYQMNLCFIQQWSIENLLTPGQSSNAADRKVNNRDEVSVFMSCS